MGKTKFRVWDKKDNRFIEGGELVFLLYPGADRNWEININEQYYGNTNNNGDNDSTRFDIMQFTGLKDKNGKEIYEGDVCFYSDGSGGEIIFESGTFCFKNDNQIKLPLGYFANKIEIKGNIYENPNLIDNNK